MATTPFLANAPITFASGSVDRSTFTEIPTDSSWWDSPTGARDGAPNALRFLAQMTVAAATATLEVVITRNVGSTEEIIYSETATVTAGAQRTASAGAAGNYLATVVFARSLNDYFDCVGFVADKSCRILFGCTTISSGSALITPAITRKT